MKRRGPRQEPWVIPQVMFLIIDRCPSAAQYCFLSFKYDSNQSPADPLMPYARSFFIRTGWSTVSKAFLRSKNKVKLIFRESMLSYQSMLLIREVMVEHCF